MGEKQPAQEEVKPKITRNKNQSSLRYASENQIESDFENRDLHNKNLNGEGYVLDGMDIAVIHIDVLNVQHQAFASFPRPRYASMTTGLHLICSGVPLAIILP